MDALSLVVGFTGLVLQCGKVLQDLHTIQERYKTADLTVISMHTSLETIQWAWRRIQNILEIWTDDKLHIGQHIDTDTLNQLDRSLNGGRIVISALEHDLLPFTAAASAPGSSTATENRFINRVQVVWNATALREHQDRIRDQMNSMNLMISVLQL